MPEVTISQDEYTALKAMEAKATAATTRLDGFEASFKDRLDALAAERDTAVSALSEAKTGFDVDRTLLGAGIKDESVIDFLRFKHGKADANEAGEKPSFGDWFTEYKGTKPAILGGLETSKTEPKETPAGGDRPDERRAVKEPVVDNSKVTPQGNQENGGAISPRDIAGMSYEQFTAYEASRTE
jgi:hypothetical protein